MIVRILGEGQLQVDDAAADELNRLDAALETAVDQGDKEGFQTALSALIERVKSIGSPAAADLLQPSALIVPSADATMEDVRKLLAGDGSIPG